MTGPTDPLHALRAPVAPVDPDPGFAAALRARIERALLAPEGTAMTASTTERPTTPAGVRPHALTPYLAVTDAARTIEFYVAAFGAVRLDEPIVMPDGRIGHAELAVGDSVLMLADEFPEIGLAAPTTRGGASQSLRLEVADPDAVVAAAVAAGAILDRPVTDAPHGRGGVVLDPAGHRWMISRSAPTGPRAGDLGYASLWTPDVEAAERFYTAVLGWTATGVRGGRGRRIEGLATHLGMWGGRPRPTLMPCWAVPDADDAAALVRAAGGTTDEPVDEPYGRVVECADDQGQPFALFTPPGGPGAGPPAPRGPGDLTYYELRSPDPTRSRAFYSTVLGWRFHPGTDAGYWHPLVDGGWPAPSCGLVRGETTVVVPWFRVTDAAAAAAAVRAAGGTATAPAPGREGLVAECVDDQGAPFCLVQL
ncbi:VOC family protein [Pseudonocardia humida]|uniref:VOC family protein n=1 Tax=Pseudonocardia humida TaxID=2800819 RepID=A0ABT0ZTB6_9PSEU|nr:VOC family protein [Pseudonocardia humida]MCO1653982.1 VOC family protein [Pseudonocardia humida]